MLKTKQYKTISLGKSQQSLCTTGKQGDHHDRFVLNGEWGLVRAWELKGDGERHVLQSSAVCLKSQNNSPPILIFILFPDKGHNSKFSSNWFLFFFSIEEFQEKDHAWKSPFHYLWTEAAEKCSEKWHPKVKKREMVLHLLLSLTSIPLLNLEYLVSLPLCGCFHLCNCVGVTTLNSAAVLRLSFAYSFVTPTLFHLKDLLAAGESLWEYLNACPGTVISEFSRRATNW